MWLVGWLYAGGLRLFRCCFEYSMLFDLFMRILYVADTSVAVLGCFLLIVLWFVIHCVLHVSLLFYVTFISLTLLFVYLLIIDVLVCLSLVLALWFTICCWFVSIFVVYLIVAECLFVVTRVVCVVFAAVVVC